MISIGVSRKGVPKTLRALTLLASAILTLMAPDRADALDPHKKLSQYGLEAWQAKQGLANGGILCIAQSADGYLWLGTRRGLVRFDGTEFRLFDRIASGGLIGWNVYHIEPRPDGSILFSTEGGAGLIEFRNGKFSKYPTPTLPGRNIRIFHEARDGTLWIGETGFGLFRIEKGNLKIYNASNGVGVNIKTILESKDGSLWIATYGDGVIHLDGEHVSRYGIQQGLLSEDVRAILEDPDGSMWFSTLAGLVHWRDGKSTVFTRRDGLSHDRTFPLCRDRGGNLWIGTEGGGLNRLTGGHFTALTTSDGLTSDEIRTVFEDREGNLWFGSADGALFRLRDEKLTVFTRHEGLSSDLVRAVFEDRDAKIWVGTADGINLLQGDRILRPTEPRVSGSVTTMIQDHLGGFWIGTLGHGLLSMRNGQTKVYFPNQNVNSLFEDRQGDIWAGVLPGLLRIHDGQAQRVGIGTPIERSRVVAILQDAQDVVWAAAANTLLRTDGTGSKAYSLQDGGCPGSVTSLHLDEPGALWIGTTEGLCRFREGAFQHYAMADGLLEDQVSSILEDDQGFLWLSGYRGFSRIAKSAVRQPKRGVNAPLPVWFIEHANGTATSSGSQMPSAWKGRDGRLWFGSLRGLISIDPVAARPDPLPVPIVIEEMLADRSPQLATGPAAGPRRLPAVVRDVEFHFVGLSLGDPAGVRFKYQLEGYDSDWTDAGSRRVAFYTNLPSGSYRFRVTAANSDGVWNEQAATMAFVKDAHLYETWWMRLLFAGVVGGAIWLTYRVRVSGLNQRFAAVLAERTRIARELHDTVEQGLTGVMLQLDTVAAHWSGPPEVRRGLDLARNMARHCMGEARSAVRDLRSESLNSGDAVAALRQMAVAFASNGTPEIHVDVQGVPCPLPRDAEMTLLRIGQEALTNAIKHAHATRIDLQVQFATHDIDLLVRDNGVGFVAESSLASAASGHFGLLGMRERANKVGGKLVIHSGQDGTTVNFRIPFAKSNGKAKLGEGK